MRRETTAILILLAIVGICGAALADSPGELRQQAGQLARQGQWQQAVKLYREALKAAPEEPWTWFALGSVLHGMGDHQGAVDAWEKSIEHQVSVPAYVQYNLACAQAKLGKRDAAFTSLEAAIQSGLFGGDAIGDDPDLESLHRDPEFAKLRKRADDAHRPCLNKPAYRQLDFWLGNWDVRIQAGFLASRDTVERSEDGCVIEQIWNGTLGNTGRAYYFYDAGRDRWTQTWVGSAGAVGTMTGSFVEGKLVLTGPGLPGQTARTSLVRVDENRVDLINETSEDGETWSQTSVLHFHRAER